jgi:hypothetical protein
MNIDLIGIILVALGVLVNLFLAGVAYGQGRAYRYVTNKQDKQLADTATGLLKK